MTQQRYQEPDTAANHGWSQAVPVLQVPMCEHVCLWVYVYMRGGQEYVHIHYVKVCPRICVLEYVNAYVYTRGCKDASMHCVRGCVHTCV